MALESTSIASPSTLGIIGPSPALREVLQLAQRAAKSNASILLLGELGTGKELLAQAVHQWSNRHAGPFVRVRGNAKSEDSFKRDLFGPDPGHPDGDSDETGKLQQASGGTLFFDEIHAVPLAIQSLLLDVLQGRRVANGGTSNATNVDIRWVAASDRDLYAEVIAGRFREDLYWRLNIVPIYLPPLRRRREDIPSLVEHFLKVFCQVHSRGSLRVSAPAMAALQQYAWPGNVRELQNYIERAVVLAEGSELSPELLPGVVSGQSNSEMGVFRGADPKSLIEEFVHNEVSTVNGDTKDLHARIVNPVERELIIQVMQLCNNVQKKAADRLGMNRNTLHKKLKEYEIE